MTTAHASGYMGFVTRLRISLPADCEDLIRERVRTAEARGEIEVWTTVIHGALWEMCNRRKTKTELRLDRR